MENLELDKLGIVSLSKKDKKELNGGFGPLFWTLAFAAAYDASQNGEEISAALEAGLKGEDYPD